METPGSVAVLASGILSFSVNLEREPLGMSVWWYFANPCYYNYTDILPVKFIRPDPSEIAPLLR